MRFDSIIYDCVPIEGVNVAAIVAPVVVGVVVITALTLLLIWCLRKPVYIMTPMMPMSAQMIHGAAANMTLNTLSMPSIQNGQPPVSFLQYPMPQQNPNVSAPQIPRSAIAHQSFMGNLQTAQPQQPQQVSNGVFRRAPSPISSPMSANTTFLPLNPSHIPQISPFQNRYY